MTMATYRGAGNGAPDNNGDDETREIQPGWLGPTGEQGFVPALHPESAPPPKRAGFRLEKGTDLYSRFNAGMVLLFIAAVLALISLVLAHFAGLHPITGLYGFGWGVILLLCGGGWSSLLDKETFKSEEDARENISAMFGLSVTAVVLIVLIWLVPLFVF